MKVHIQPCQPDRWLTTQNISARRLVREKFESFGGSIADYTDGYADYTVARQYTDLLGLRRLVAVQTITLDPAGYLYEFQFALMNVMRYGPFGIPVSNDTSCTIRYKPETAYMALDREAHYPVIMADENLDGMFRPEENFYPSHDWDGAVRQIYSLDFLIHPRSKPMPAAQALALL